MIPAEMESAGLASACIAASLKKDCLFEYKMKINYPVINYKFVTETENLGDAIAELTDPSQHIPFPLVSFSFLLNLQWRKPSNSILYRNKDLFQYIFLHQLVH
jgi:hypothetical protein